MLATQNTNTNHSSPHSLARSFFTLTTRSMDSSSHDQTDQEFELESFQKQVTAQFTELSSSSPDEFLSLSWIRNLLDVFIFCQEEYRLILFNNKSYLLKPPMDRLINEFYDRSVKALDVCNAIRDGIEQIKQWEKLLEIVLVALDKDNKTTFSEGQIRRAKKALVDLTIGMLDEKESNTGLAHRNRSFGRNNANNATGGGKVEKNLGHFRSLSWSVSRSWSANRQLQAMANNLNAPKGNEISSSNGLAVTVYTMSYVLLLVMWILVAAIPCQDRGLGTHFYVPRQFGWAGAVMGIHEKVMDESKKRERKNACGLLKEIYGIEKWSRGMSELLDMLVFPLNDEKEVEIREKVGELKKVFESLKEGLEPLEKQVREVFHRIIRSRTEGLDCLVGC